MRKYGKLFLTILTLCLALVLAFTVAGCGGETGGGDNTPSGDNNYGAEEYWVERIEVEKGEGFREDYADGDAFDTTGLIVTAYWNDGWVEDVPAIKYTVVPSIITEGVTEVTIIYGDAQMTIPISSVQILGLEIAKMPSNTAYFVGETFKPDGMVLRYKLDDGTTRDIAGFDTADVTFSSEPLEIGDTEVEVTYNGYTCMVPITVLGRGIKIEANSEAGDVVIEDPEDAAKPHKPGTNAEIKKFASNGDFMQDFSEGCTMTFKFTAETEQVHLLLQASSTYVTEYSDIVTYYPLTVADMQVSRIFDMTVNGVPVPINDTAVLLGSSTTDPSGSAACLANWTEVDLGIANVYTDRENTVTLTFKDNGYRNEDQKTGTLTGGMPAPYIDYFMVANVEDDDIVTGIEITKQPAKTDYVEGQTFDRTGMEVTATHKDGSREVVTAYGVTPLVLSTVGDGQKVTVSYAGCDAEVTVNVIARVQTGIEVTKMPDKTVYLTGETFDPTGMEVSAVFNDGSKELLVSTPEEEPLWTYAPQTALVSGTNEITVTSGDYTAKIEVSAKAQTGVKITTPPNTVEYANGMPFDPTGMVVVAVYDDESEQVVTDYTIEPAGGLTTGTTEVTVKHNGFETKQAVTVTSEEVFSHITVSGVPADEVAIGSPLPSVDAGSLTVTAHYFSGKTETLSSDKYDVTIPTGNAEFGSAVVVTLKDDPSVRSVAPFNVSEKINIVSDMVTGSKYYRTDVAWAPGAFDNDFMQSCINDSVITFEITSASDCNAVLTLTGASAYVTQYSGGNLPKNLSDMYCSVMFDLKVNGEIVTVSEDAKFTGGEYETASNNNLAVWSDAVLATVKLKAGENTVQLVFKEYKYENNTTNTSGKWASPNLDYLTVTAVA